MPYLDREDAEIYYETSGEGEEWVTLINGHTRSIKDFAMMRKSINNAGFSVLTVENRGAGKTRVQGPFSIEDMTQDIVAVWDLLGIKKSAVVGISMGGVIAQILALSGTGVVTKLVLVSTAHDRKYIQSPGVGWGSTLDSVVERLSFFFADSFIAGNMLLIKAMAKTILKQIESGDFSKKSELQSAALRELTGSSPIHDIGCPTLIIHGAEDKIISADVAKDMAADINASKLVIFNRVGHLLLAEAPKKLYETIIDFL